MSHVPPILHQAWLGDMPLWVPYRLAVMRSACEAAEIEYRFWDLETVAERPEGRNLLALYERYGLSDYRIAADLLRMWLLSTFGGIWSDADIVPLVPLDAFVNRPAWVCVQPSERRRSQITSQGLFALPPGNAITPFILSYATQQLQAGVRNPHFIAGPRAFRAAEDAFPGEVERIYRLVFAPEQTLAAASRGLDLESLRQKYSESWFVHTDAR